MQKILISVSNDTIRFSYQENTTISTDLSKTNIIDNQELTFSEAYIKNNPKMVSLFIKDLCAEKKIYCASIETNELAILLMDLLKKNPYITAICIREDAVLSFALYEKIIENKNIQYVEASSIQDFMIELFDKKGIRSESRTEVFYPSHFMQSNNLTSFSKIFYKMNIRIDHIFTEEDKDDFNAFCTVNKYLKSIHLDLFNKNDLENMIIILEENHIKNIRFLIYETIKDYKTIDYLKKINKKIKKKKLKIELVYSKEYLNNNLFIQIILNTLKVCGIIMLIIVASIIGYIGISNYVAFQEVSEIQENVKGIILENQDKEVEPPTNDKRAVKNNYLISLLNMNKDVVGWLKVNETNIDYPVVQASDNEYYLKHNLYNEEDKNGWVFMDYRNSKYNLDTNTIIFGHNMYYSGIMFGTLSNAYKKTWYSNPDNLIISYDTVYESNQYQIFSIYKVPKTNDYLKTYFADDTEFNNFISLIKERSINDFGIEVKPGDKILTLSTCSNYNDRLVIHAKLITPES